MHNVDVPETNPRYYLPAATLTIARRLKNQGVATAHFGKWHLGDPGQNRVSLNPDGFGFDRVFISPGGRPSSAWLDQADYFDPYFFDVDLVKGQTTYTATQFSGYAEDIVFAQVIAWLQEHYSEDFYIQIWTFAPHEPLSESVDESSNPAYSGYSVGQKTYWGTMTNLDNNIGALVTALSSLGILSSTHLVYTSDNGPESTGAYGYGETGGLRGKKTNLWEGGIRAPFIMRGPGITAATTDSDARWALDWVPTVLNLFGLSTTGFPGSDMLSAAPSRDLNWYHPWPQRPTDNSGEVALLRWPADRKLIVFQGAPDTYEFYNIDTDPNETTDTTGEDTTEESAMISAADTWLAALPGSGGTNAAVQDPSTIAAANALSESWAANAPDPEDYRAHACGSGAELTAFESALDSLFQLPKAAACSHGLPTVTEQTHGSVRDTQDFFGSSSVVSHGVVDACQDPSKRTNCTAGELVDIDTVLARVTGNKDGS